VSPKEPKAYYLSYPTVSRRSSTPTIIYWESVHNQEPASLQPGASSGHYFQFDMCLPSDLTAALTAHAFSFFSVVWGSKESSQSLLQIKKSFSK